MWHVPISGSQINKPAKLFKRFTPTEAVTVGGSVIKYENNYYRTYASLPYIEATDRQEGDEQTLTGLPYGAANMTIKYNGAYKIKPGCLTEAEDGDLLMLEGELWIIEDGVQRVRNKSMVGLATVYLPLRKIS